MSEKVKGFVVTLEHEITIDDAKIIMQAISMIKGVADVEHSISNHVDYMNRQMVKSEIRGKFIEFYTKELQ